MSGGYNLTVTYSPEARKDPSLLGKNLAKCACLVKCTFAHHEERVGGGHTDSRRRALYSEEGAVLGGISAAVPGWETCGSGHAVSVGLYGEGKETVHVCSG
jgi:hypothetical protein